jgi:xanthine dehydrogenase YagT iron-sulfur-binding subunit
MTEDALPRREFLKTTSAMSALILGSQVAATNAAASAATTRAAAPPTVPVRLRINGADHGLDLDPRATLLDTLRERIGLTGTKKGCDRGECGACTVHVNGRRINSCMTLAVMQQGKEITTIEGIARNEALHPVQVAFIEHDAFQCGYCTPGQIMSAVACIREGHTKSAEEIREWMSGNICRCSAYPNIVAAIEDAARKG